MGASDSPSPWGLISRQLTRVSPISLFRASSDDSPGLMIKRIPLRKWALAAAGGMVVLLILGLVGGFSTKAKPLQPTSPPHSSIAGMATASKGPSQVNASGGHFRSATGKMKSAGEVPDDLWLALGTARRNIRPMVGELEGASHYAHHPEQKLTVRFNPQGVSIRPSGKAQGNGAWDLVMTSASAGEGSTISVDGTRAEYRHPDGVVEWFENRVEGIEHGFTINRPRVSEESGLTLTVKLAGMTAEGNGESGELLLRSPDGIPRLNYSGLKVWDAHGDVLPATMEASEDEILIAVNDEGATYPVTVDPLITTYREKIDMLEPALGDSHNQFGKALAFDGETALVGVPEDNTLAGEHAGSVYVFRRSGGEWLQEAWLTASEGDGYEKFGSAVVLQGDTAFIGAPGFVLDGDATALRGGVHVFNRAGGAWALHKVIAGAEGTAGEDFGAALAVSGTTLLVGASGDTSSYPYYNDLDGSVFVFEESGDAWSQTAKLIDPDGADQDLFGAAVAIDGDRAVVGAPDDDQSGGMVEGSVHIFSRTAGIWSHVKALRVSGSDDDAAFGSAIDLEGDILLVGAPNVVGPSSVYEGGVFEFAAVEGSWSLKGRLSPATDDVVGFGRAVLLNGGQAIVGAPGRGYYYSPKSTGSVHFFQRSGDGWSESGPLRAPNGYLGDTFGFPLALGGQNLLVGMGSAGSYADYTINGAECVHVFSGSGGTWQPETVLRPTDGGDQTYCGTAVAIDGERCVIGLPYDDSGVNDFRGGSAYVLSRESGSWTLESRLSDWGNPGAIEFGLAVAIEGDLVVIGSEEGAFAYRFDGFWRLEEIFTPSVHATDDKFGGAVSISQGRVAVGAPFLHYRAFGSNGKAFIFARNGESGWQQIALLEANETFPPYPPYRPGDLFGDALSFDGNRLIVGAPGRYAVSERGKAYVFVEEDGVWKKEASLAGSTEGENPSGFGAAVALDGDQALIGALGEDQACYFQREGGEWLLRQTISS
ncbi:MAG: hypothetical protein EOP83_11235, partial [Verrucomicrobiaceae bacterium]